MTIRTKPLIALICAVLAVASILAIVATQDGGTRTEPPDHTPGMIGIGYVQSGDYGDKVAKLLEANSILYVMVGGLTTGIYVPKKDATRAMSLISADASEKGYLFVESPEEPTN